METKELNRIIFKQGGVNIDQQNVGQCTQRFLKDGFTTFIDAKWRYTLLMFFLLYLTSWTFYGAIWYLMALGHGDISYYGRYFASDDQALFEKTNPFTPCVRYLHSYTSAFLFSIETQHTIGYGHRHVTEECIGGSVLVAVQSIFGTLLQCFLVGGIVAKLARPKRRAQNIIFSKNAVISHRDGCLYLMFRIGDIRRSHFVHSTIKARITRNKLTKEGELINFYQQELTLKTDECDDRVLLMFPTIITHQIDIKSPLYGLSLTDLQREQFEIIVMLEGSVESTGLAAQGRTSYLPSEILLGHRFQNMFSYNEKSEEYHVDYDLFHKTIKVEEFSNCATKEFEEKGHFNSNILNSYNTQGLILTRSLFFNENAKTIL